MLLQHRTVRLRKGSSSSVSSSHAIISTNKGNKLCTSEEKQKSRFLMWQPPGQSQNLHRIQEHLNSLTIMFKKHEMSLWVILTNGATLFGISIWSMDEIFFHTLPFRFYNIVKTIKVIADGNRHLKMIFISVLQRLQLFPRLWLIFCIHLRADCDTTTWHLALFECICCLLSVCASLVFSVTCIFELNRDPQAFSAMFVSSPCFFFSFSFAEIWILDAKKWTPRISALLYAVISEAILQTRLAFVG